MTGIESYGCSPVSFYQFVKGHLFGLLFCLIIFLSSRLEQSLRVAPQCNFTILSQDIFLACSFASYFAYPHYWTRVLWLLPSICLMMCHLASCRLFFCLTFCISTLLDWGLMFAPQYMFNDGYVYIIICLYVCRQVCMYDDFICITNYYKLIYCIDSSLRTCHKHLLVLHLELSSFTLQLVVDSKYKLVMDTCKSSIREQKKSVSNVSQNE